MINFFMGWVANIPTIEDAVNNAIGYEGLPYWSLLRCVDVCMDIGVICVEQCGYIIAS
jgi:hypothetical protein